MANNNKAPKRGKKEKSVTTTAATATDRDEDPLILKALEKVQQSRMSTATLHSQWRLHLLRLGYMVVIISLHQWQGPITDCLYDVKSYNKSFSPLDDESLKVSGLQAIYYVLNDTFGEFLGVVMGIVLVLFLNQQYHESLVTLVYTPSGTAIHRDSFFTNKLYMAATALVPAVVNLFFHNRAKNRVDDYSCLDHSAMASVDTTWKRSHDSSNSEETTTTVRGFPVIVVFHVMATGCCWFMDLQQSQSDQNIKRLEKLRQDLAASRTDQTADKKKKS